jgi:hypothetical protein
MRLLPLWTLAFFALADTGPKFYPDDPLAADPDNLPIEKPAVVDISPTYDVLEKTFAPLAIEGEIPRAMNANTLGEVPESSWFENRIGIRSMSLDELTSGPSAVGPPAAPLTVIAGKSSGITPGFTLRDARGNVYFVKFDPASHPSLSTAAEVIGTRFFHAIGYNVPETYLLYLRSSDLAIEPEAQAKVKGGGKAPLDRELLETILEGAARLPDGRVRVVASLAAEGDPIGPFRFHGSRPDDPNDIVPHEHRRELRGYRVFCAWLNHDDSRAVNTLDTYVGEPGRGHVRHYLLDFSSILGSGSDTRRRIAPQDPRAGNEYLVDFEPTWKAFYTFGFADRFWRRVRYPYPQYAEAGRIESEYFDPARWKPEYPNPAFDRMLDDDAFWAAKIVSRFEDGAIRAIVAKGEFRAQDAERYLADTIIRRRDKVVDHYYRRLNPLDDFTVDGAIRFRNLGAERALGDVRGYGYEWFTFDNETGQISALGANGRSERPEIPFPDTGGSDLMVRLRTDSESVPSWRKAVDLYFRSRRLVGIEREIGEWSHGK